MNLGRLILASQARDTRRPDARFAQPREPSRL